MVLSRTYNNEKIFVLGFPIGLGPRTLQGLGSVQNFIIIKIFVLGFPIGLGPRTIQGLGSVQNCMPLFFYAPGLPSGISQVSEQEVALGNSYSLVWVVVRGPPCGTGLRRELTKPTDLDAFPWSLVTRYFLASQYSRCAFTRPL